MLSEIEMSGIITGRIVHQGTHGNTKKFRITVSPDMVKTTFKDEMLLEDIL
jgi:cell division control protein 6